MSIPDPTLPRLKPGDRVAHLDGVREGTIASTLPDDAIPRAEVAWDDGPREWVAFGFLERRPRAYAPPEHQEGKA